MDDEQSAKPGVTITRSDREPEAMGSDSLAEALDRDWDAIVIGGGMGGGAIAYRLSTSGLDVLLIEKGSAQPIVGNRASTPSEDGQFRLDHGQWPTKYFLNLDGTRTESWPVVGCGVGGSTLFYAASLARLEARDFDDTHDTDGRQRRWPFQYQDLEPYYLEAERLFEVNGTPDSLDVDSEYQLLDPPAMGERDRHYFTYMRSVGLHPYRIHNAIRYVPDCQECAGIICEQACKGDANNRLITPARATGRLTILDRSEVLSIQADKTSATGVELRHEGIDLLVRGREVILAAGALATPALLQRSVSDAWPKGIGNDNDLVGRNLMFHATDFVAVWPRSKARRQGPSRTIALRDFYVSGEDKLGEFQSMGLQAGYGEILTFLHQQVERTVFRHLPFLRQLLRIPAYLGARLFSDASVFATIVEDYPYHQNRVVANADSPAGYAVEYNIAPELKRRVRLMRSLIKQRLVGLKVMIVNTDVALNFGHACGTCAAGDDPATSVIDRDCRIHNMDNLYVVDGSFMPTSGGTNPSLTIAANALRVGDVIAARYRQGAA